MTSARRVFDLRRRPSRTLNLVSYVAFRTTEMKVQWCPDLVYPDLVDCRDLVD